eukprot:TRINITY_DN32667_c0_g1_i1.p1 TRINITY_DN32667_c0_g1~~TRINITY_DN32667_c0_g1_i1.p1  ORF type:complete len:598 (+),score=104.39 TRINITY_DN32667_c0_g1_i1:55-1848(+)
MTDVARDAAWEPLRSQLTKSSVSALEHAETTQQSAWQTLRTPRTPRMTRTPRMETKVKPGDRVKAWKNFEEQRTQELLYRSEYLAGLLSSAAEIDAPPLEELRATLQSSPAPLLIQAVSERIDLANAKAGFVPPKMVLPATDVLHRRQRLGWPQEGHLYPAATAAASVPPQGALLQQSAQAQRARLLRELDQEASKDPALTPMAQGPRLRTPLAAAGTAGGTMEPADSQSRPSTALHSLDAWRETCEGVNTMLDSTPPALGEVSTSRATHRLNNTALKVATVPGVHDDAFDRDHKATLEAQRMRELSSCENVFCLLEDGVSGKATQAEMQFAKFYGQLKLLNYQVSVFPKQFQRLDGLETSSTHRYTLTDAATSIVRNNDAFHKIPALLTSVDTVPIFADGYYFEVKVTSVFRTLGPAARPKPEESRGRSAGLVLGLMASPPSKEDQKAKYASDLSECWCISTHGFYYACPRQRPGSPTRPSSEQRVAGSELPLSWRRKKPVPRPATGEQLACSWPAPSTGDTAVSRKLDWSVALNEGDTVGLLLLPSGALMMTCNGRRVVIIADAALTTDRMYYPLVEVSNHIRSVKLAPMAWPPP